MIGLAQLFAQAAAKKAAAASSGGTLSYRPLLWFGGIALGFVGVVQVIRTLRGESFSVTFARLYGLIMLATLASVLVFADVDASAKTGAFTLLGTIAGYLAGAKPTAGGGGGGNERALRPPGEGGPSGGEQVL